MKEQAKRELEAAFPEIWIRPDGAFHLNEDFDDRSFAWSPILQVTDGSEDDLQPPRLRVRHMKFTPSELRVIINYIEAFQPPASASSTELRDAPPAASEKSGGEIEGAEPNPATLDVHTETLGAGIARHTIGDRTVYSFGAYTAEAVREVADTNFSAEPETRGGYPHVVGGGE